MSFNQSKNSLNDISKMERNHDQSENRVSDNQMRGLGKLYLWQHSYKKIVRRKSV